MSFDRLSLSPEKMRATGQICNRTTCGCDTCPVRDVCAGPSDKCSAKFCSTRTRQPEGCYSCRAICNKHFAKDLTIKSLKGIQFDDVTWNPFDLDIPPVMFQINSLVNFRPEHTYLINAKKLTYNDSENWSPQKDLRRRFKIPKETNVGISFFTHDQWMDRYAANMSSTCGHIKRFQPDFVFGMDFSCYENYPRFDTIVNLRRRILSVKLLQEVGIKVIPDLGWITDEDMKRTLSWASSNNLKYASINMQTVAVPVHNPAWSRYLGYLEQIRKALPDTKLILVGCSASNRMKSIYETIGKFHLVDTRCYRLAEYHKDVEGNKLSKSIPVLTQFDNNVSQMLATYEEIMNG